VGERLIQFDSSRGITVQVKELAGDIQGVSTGGSFLVATTADTKTLIHEIAYEQMHKSDDRPNDRILLELEHLHQEELWQLLLATRNRVLKVCRLYRDSLNQSQVRIAEVIKQAIIKHVTAIIIAHNNPSDDTSPRPDDVVITWVIVEAVKLLDGETEWPSVLAGGPIVVDKKDLMWKWSCYGMSEVNDIMLRQWG